MSYLRTFTPWIAYVALSAVLDWRPASVVALVVAAAVVLRLHRDGILDALTIGTLGFFTILGIVSLSAPNSGFHHWTPSASLGTLGLVALVSLLVDRPFTLPIARSRVTPEVAATPLFLRVNKVITGAWAASLLATCAVVSTLLSGGAEPVAAIVAAEVAGFALPAAFTRAYPDHVRRRIGLAPATATSSL